MVDQREFRFEFPCPKCQSRLRLKDRSLIGTRWRCPDCESDLEIKDAGEGRVEATLAVDANQRSTTSNRRSISPQTAAALVAATLIAGIAVFVLWAPDTAPEPTVAAPAEPASEPPVVPQPPADPIAPPAVPVDPVESQLKALGGWLANHHDKTGAFPPGVMAGDLPVNELLGWLAQYREETEPTETVHAQHRHGWRAPANEPFVRRRAPSLLNPNVSAVASDDGFPATHFVGVAGVGADAARLAKSHPRAGVFGFDRRTTLEDIKDGTANTLMVIGVETHPPAWADGAKTVRGLTAEPYFGGPDHLGTGRADGMHVLMADGSVRFLSKDTDPRLMRRMAAMADGLPLDASVPGEPADPPTPPEAATPASDPPITVEVTPDSKGYDVDRGLSIAVARFELKTPVPLRTLLRQIVEMSALPIDLSQVHDDPRLDHPVTLDLKDTTLRAILSAALAQAQLEFTGDAQGIHLQPVKSP